MKLKKSLNDKGIAPIIKAFLFSTGKNICYLAHYFIGSFFSSSAFVVEAVSSNDINPDSICCAAFN